MSVETAIYDAIATAIAAADEGDALFEAELNATIYEVVTKAHCVRIEDADFDFAPLPGGDDWEEFDVLATVQIVARVEADTAAAVEAAREAVRAISLAVAKALGDDVTLGGAVNDSRILGGRRGWANVQTVRHAVALLHLIANETGAISQ